MRIIEKSPSSALDSSLHSGWKLVIDSILDDVAGRSGLDSCAASSRLDSA